MQGLVKGGKYFAAGILGVGGFLGALTAFGSLSCSVLAVLFGVFLVLWVSLAWYSWYFGQLWSVVKEGVHTPRKFDLSHHLCFAGLTCVTVGFIFHQCGALMGAAANDEKPPQFDSLAFKVLVLPFRTIDDCTIRDAGVEHALVEHIREIARRDSIRIHAIAFTPANCPAGLDSVYQLGLSMGADLVLWGDLYESCATDTVSTCISTLPIAKEFMALGGQPHRTSVKSTLLQLAMSGLRLDVDFIALYTVGMRDLKAGEYVRSARYFQKVIQSDYPTRYCAHIPYSVCMTKLGDTLAAVEALRESIVLEPTASAVTNLAFLCSKARLGFDCDSLYQAGYDLDSNSVRVILNHANNLEKTGAVAEAERLYTKVAEVYREPGGYVGLALIAYREHDIARSIELNRQAMQLDPTYYRGWHNLGLAYFRERRYPEALVAFRRELPSKEQRYAGLYMLGLVHKEMGRMDSAQVYYRASIVEDPDLKTSRNDSIFGMH